MKKLNHPGSCEDFNLSFFGSLPSLKKESIFCETDFKVLGSLTNDELTQVENSVLKMQQANKLSEVEYEGEAKGILTGEDTSVIRESLLVESVRSAFGISRGGQNRKPKDEDWEWINSKNQDLPFSFEQCCYACGLDPEKMLTWLRYYRRKLFS